MAGKLEITGLVPQQTIDELNNIIALFGTVKKTFADLTKEMAKELKINPKALDDLALKGTEVAKVYAKLAETQNEMSRIQGEYQKVLAKLSETQKVKIAGIVEEAKANDLNAAAALKVEKAETERLKRMKSTNTERAKEKISIEEVTKIMSKEVASIKEAEEANKRLRQQVKLITDEEDRSGDIRRKINGQIAVNTNYIERNSDALIKSKINIGNYSESIKKAWVEIKNGEASLKNFGIVATNVGNIAKGSLAGGFNEVRMGVTGMIKGFIGAQAIVGAFMKLIGLFQSGISSIVDFEAANSKLAAVLGTTSKNIKDLTSDAQRLGAATKYTASEATKLQIELAKLGFSKNEILQSTESILKFAQATGAELPEAAALAGASIRMFGATTQETERYVSAMAVATTKSALSFSYLQTAMPIVGPVAKSFNFHIEDTLALLGKLADAGFDASMSATATRNILLNLADGSGKLATALGGPVKTLPELVVGLKKLKDQGIDLNTTLELTDKRSVAAFNAFLTAADGLVPLREQITGVTGELGDMADTMTNNVEGAIAGLSSAWEAFMLSFSNSTGPAKDVIDFFAKGIRGIANDLRSYSQIQDEADNASVSRAQKEMSTSKILQNNRENMSRLYKEKLNEVMSSDEAAIAAKEEYIAGLKSTFDAENTAYQTSIFEREKLESELSNRGLTATLFSWRRTNNVIKEEIETATSAASGKKALASITESVINDLNKIDLKQAEVSEKPKKQLTDKEKKELEKAAKESLKIREDLQQSEIDLMSEGLDKEIAKISIGFTKKIAAIKGNSAEEIKIRENLAEEMQRKISDFSSKYVLDIEKSNIDAKLSFVKKGSDEEFELRSRLLDIQKNEEVLNAEKTGADVSLIIEKYNFKKLELMQKFADEKNKKIQEEYATSSIFETSLLQKDFDDLAEQYSSVLIDKETFEKEKLRLTEEYGIKQAQKAIELAKIQLATSDLSPEAKLALEKKISDAEIEIANKTRDAKIRATDDAAKAQEERLKRTMDIVAGVADALDAFSQLGSALFEADIQKIEEQSSKAQEEKEKEIERISELERNGTITKEESEARKRAAESASARKTEELENKKAALKTKQAKMDKANAVIQTIINTALGITKTIAELGLPLAIPFVAIAGALGAVQLATIIAQPIPKYKDGTKDHKGGMAIVGDGGRKELVMTNNGYWVTPDKPTLVDLPKHAKVFPDLSMSPAFLKSDFGISMQGKEMSSPVVNITNNFAVLEDEMRSLRYSNDRLSKNMKKSISQSQLNQIAMSL